MILSFFAVWAVVGVGFYLFMIDKIIKKKPQEIAFFVISGPLVWVFLPIIRLMDFMSEKLFEPIYRWLTQE